MNIAIIAAAGKSKRTGTKTPKLLLPVLSKPLIYFTIAAFYDHPQIDRIVIPVSKKIKKSVEKVVQTYFKNRKKEISVVLGAGSRSESILNALTYIKRYVKPRNKDLVLIHNGANPLVTYDEIKKCIKETEKKGACIVSHSLKDTLKEINKKKIIKTHDREKFIKAQTPQCFTFDILKKSLIKAGGDYSEMTDEASLVESAGYSVSHIPASENNFKVTTRKDYERVKQILGDFPENFSVGIGQDSHEFSDEQGLVLGGLEFLNENKLKANSDGDVMLHSLCNAILQATGDKSLGAFANEMCIKKGIKDSKKYLMKILKKMERKKYKLNNIGFMIEGKRPGIDKISNKLKENISKLTGLPLAKIGITATSGENLTSFGKGKGLQVFSIVSLKKHDS
jgi:2-C-methyl-D-erythritol 4-phosphate cytidylyltransferase/2-C-methyl-D-erythritol 2,4-cyclodiphosphate synthase